MLLILSGVTECWEATLEFAPDIYPFVYSDYSVTSSLFWEGQIIQSAGLQQEDPLGP